MEGHFLSMEKKPACNIGSVTSAENAHGQLRPPCPHKAADSNYLSLSHLEGNTVHHLPVRIQGMVYAPVLHLNGNIPHRDAFTLWETVHQFAANHAFDDPVLCDGICFLIQGLYGRSVADNRNLIRNIGYFIQFMGNDDACHAF